MLLGQEGFTGVEPWGEGERGAVAAFRDVEAAEQRLKEGNKDVKAAAEFRAMEGDEGVSY